ncbi:DUF4832 domain-containing protein [Dyella sp. GSA-30]|uniref:DUF4832 domain-containing protein n=1 Tax=Dyella sp. GSA-30 TaxID=2994496 RepID=UPI002493B0A9|nr:DUF4832 domain-containing protein [Dyella sp. GSA-30]BDU21641.1 beta-galactosidase [Dyella sp. GSA-30]
MHRLNRWLIAICAFTLITFAFETEASAKGRGDKTEGNTQVIVPVELPAQATPSVGTDQWNVTGELFNPSSGFYVNVAQRQIGSNNPPCPHCEPNLEFQYTKSDAAPLPGSPVNLYGRVSWHTLEPLQGRYDFSTIDHVLEPCASSTQTTPCLKRGMTFGFRVMAFNPQHNLDTNISTGADGYPIYSDSPAYLMKDGAGKAHGWLLPLDPNDLTQGHYFIPDWNDPFVIQRVTELMKALGHRYDDDPRIGTIDIGLYGSWGEWHTAGLPDTSDYKFGKIPYAPTDAGFDLNQAAYLTNNGVMGAYAVGSEASKTAIIWAHVHAFSKKQLVMLTDDADSLCTAMRIHGDNLPIGLRRDSLGSYSGWSAGFPLHSICTAADGQDLVAERWKLAPFIAEPFGNGSSPTFPCQTFESDPTTGQLAIVEQVSQYHIAAIKNASYCAGTWSALTQAEQGAVWTAGLTAGSRYLPAKITLSAGQMEPGRRVLSMQTEWSNAGATPTYAHWRVEFRLRAASTAQATLWNRPSVSLDSEVDLRKVLPGSNYTFDDSFKLPPDTQAGTYELDVRVVDENHYLEPMQLALASQAEDGFYQLGTVEIPPSR